MFAESFVDDGGRGVFQNAAEYWQLYPDAAALPARYCAPRLEHGAIVDGVRARLAARSAAGGFTAAVVPEAEISMRVISVRVPAGAGVLRLDEVVPSAPVIGVILDGERLDPVAGSKIEFEPAAVERWCHIEVVMMRDDAGVQKYG